MKETVQRSDVADAKEKEESKDENEIRVSVSSIQVQLPVESQPGQETVDVTKQAA